MSEFNEITNEILKEYSASALRQFIGPKKQYSYEAAANAIDVEVCTVESWVLGRAVPVLYKWLKLCGLLGPEFTNQYLRLVGQDSAHRVRPETISAPQLNAKVARLTSVLSDALQDMRVDHLEEPIVRRHVQTVHDVTSDYLRCTDKTIARLHEV